MRNVFFEHRSLFHRFALSPILTFAVVALTFAPGVTDETVWAADDVRLRTVAWPDEAGAFTQILPVIQENHFLNILAFPETKLVEASGLEIDSPSDRDTARFISDGDCGSIGGPGRITVDGSPSRIVYYLGCPRAVHEVRLFSGNIDPRLNQCYEIRFADNREHPGVEPDFPETPTLTSGDAVLGCDRGAFLSVFQNDSGGNLFDREYDWVEFRLTKTFPTGAGTPVADLHDGCGWNSYVEIQVLADPELPGLFADEGGKRAWRRQQRVRSLQWRLQNLPADLAMAIQDPEPLRRSIENMAEKFPDEFDADAYLPRWRTLVERLNNAATDAEIERVIADYDRFRREVLLANPLLSDFDEILIRKARSVDLVPNWVSNAQRGKGPNDNAVIAFDPKNPNSDEREITRGVHDAFIGDLCLHWNADRFLFTGVSDNGTWQVYEYDMTDGTVTQKTPDMGGDVDNVEGCYVPDGSTIFVSTASMMGIPCVGGAGLVGNLYRVEADGKSVRQLTFEQDQDWCPVLLQNGRILYLRWEYIDTPHYFSRILFTMNPDGTNQVEHYGSGSFWPNSVFYAKPIPGQSSKFVGIVTGHHGVSREGELVLFDPSLGRQEEKGAVQKIPGWGKKVEPVIGDTIVDNAWPKFLYPWPLSEDYFLVSCNMDGDEGHFDLYLVDVFDNILKLRDGGDYHLLEPIPLMEQEEPTTVANHTVEGKKDANVFITDVYFGQGLPNVPRGSVKSLRLYSFSYGYRGIGGHDVYGMESCWDGRRIIGEVPVYEDGSANFTIPANTPVAVQPLDENGAAIQLMRSWFVGMPGETESCIGCHETQNSVSPVKMTTAQRSQPAATVPFYGPERPFSFEGEIQPILDRYCVGCHDGSESDRPNFADNTPGPRGFSNAYHALARYVRRPGPESDIHVFPPMEYHVTTSELVQMLRKGHHNVKLSDESLRKLYCWIDLNVPYFGTWTEIAQHQKGEKGTAELKAISDRHVELKSLYADNDLDFEADARLQSRDRERIEFQKPEDLPDPDRSVPTLSDWPMGANAVAERQSGGGSKRPAMTVQLDESNSFEMVKIPAGTFIMGDEDGFSDELPRRPVTVEKPFWMMTTEVTNALYALYDAEHDSRFIDMWNKDHTSPGYPACGPNQPVIRISWSDAVGFCRWLEKQTGKKFRLPTEAEWEWAARGGSDRPFWFGGLDADFGPFENLADESTRLFVVGGINPQSIPDHEPWEAFVPRADGVDDGGFITRDVGAYRPNPFGLYDMIGNVCEWTASDYRPYPYVDDGRNGGDPGVFKTARGGSWRDRPKWGRAGVRKPYESWQKVYNVGFRVVCDEE